MRYRPEFEETIEIVDIFRPLEECPIVEQAIDLKEKFGKVLVVWIELGIIDEQAAEMARQAGLIVVMDKCLNGRASKFSLAGLCACLC